jgi:hypothetical protein
MPFLSKPSGAARTSITYITVGALIDVWTIICWVYLNRHPEGHSDAAYYWVYGFFFTGIVLLVIGLALGRIGRAARHAELPPEAPNEPTAEPANIVAPGIPNGTPGANNTAPQYYTMPAPVAGPVQQTGVPVAAIPAVPPVPTVAGRQTR